MPLASGYTEDMVEIHDHFNGGSLDFIMWMWRDWNLYSQMLEGQQRLQVIIKTLQGRER